MTIAQIAQQIARRTKWNNVAEMPMPDAAALALCITRGLNEWFGKANRAWTTQPLNYVLNAPLTTRISCAKDSAMYAFLDGSPAWTFDTTNFTFDGTEQTFDEFSGYAAAGAPSWLVPAFGSSVKVGGTHWNRALSSSVLLWPFTGETNADEEIQIWHNGVNLGRSIREVEGVVELMDVSGKHLRYLNHEPNKRFDTAPVQSGEPSEYQIEPVNTGFGTAPAWVLRLNPAPSARYILRCQVSRYVVTVTVNDLRRAGVLPIPDDAASSILLPIVLDLAFGEALLDPSKFIPARVMQDAVTARAEIAQRSGSINTNQADVGTPFGW